VSALCDSVRAFRNADASKAGDNAHAISSTMGSDDRKSRSVPAAFNPGRSGDHDKRVSFSSWYDQDDAAGYNGRGQSVVRDIAKTYTDPVTPHRHLPDGSPLVDWTENNPKGPYEGDRRTLHRQKLLLVDDTTLAFIGLYRAARNALSTSGYHRDILPETGSLCRNADLTVTPVVASKFLLGAIIPPQW